MTGDKSDPRDIFGSPLRDGDRIAYLRHGGLHLGIATGFTNFGVKLVDENGEGIGTVLRDRVVGPRTLQKGN